MKPCIMPLLACLSLPAFAQPPAPGSEQHAQLCKQLEEKLQQLENEYDARSCDDKTETVDGQDVLTDPVCKQLNGQSIETIFDLTYNRCPTDGESGDGGYWKLVDSRASEAKHDQEKNSAEDDEYKLLEKHFYTCGPGKDYPGDGYED